MAYRGEAIGPSCDFRNPTFVGDRTTDSRRHRQVRWQITPKMHHKLTCVSFMCVIASSLLTSACRRSPVDEYKVLAYSEAPTEKATATVQDSVGEKLEIQCYGSTVKGTDLSKPEYRTSPDKPASWEGVVGTDHWMDGCRPLPIGWRVTMVRNKYPANYLDYDAAQEERSDTYFSHSYWRILAQK